MTTPQIDPSYLADITGQLPTIQIGEFLAENGLLESMPGTVQDAYNDALEAQGDEVHSFLCNLDKEEQRGRSNNCSQSKAWAGYAKEIAAANRPYILQFELVDRFPFKHNNDSKRGITIAKPASRPGKNLRGVDGRFQRVKPRQQRQRYHVAQVNTALTRQEAGESDRHRAAVEGRDGSTIGQRALFYNHDGRVLRGTGAIARESREVALSASTATLNQTTGTAAGASPAAAPTLTAANHPNKKPAGETSGNWLGGLGTIGMLSVAMAALMPLHFVTSAISFINGLVTFFTTTRNAVETYTSIVDAALGMFGMRGATNSFKSLMESMLDGAFGKDNIDYAKLVFAKTLNTVSSAVKVAEKVQQARSSTNNRVDELAVSLGIVNNGLKDAGMLPPDSPYMSQSQAIDQFIKDRSTGAGADPDLADNLQAITGEIRTGEQVTKELKEQREREEKERQKIQKEIDDTARLVDSTKTNVEAIQRQNL
jgi:hypothetical protein